MGTTTRPAVHAILSDWCHFANKKFQEFTTEKSATCEHRISNTCAKSYSRTKGAPESDPATMVHPQVAIRTG